MSAERKPHDDDSLLALPLRWATTWVLRYPKAVVGMALLLAAAAICLSVCQMQFHTSRLDLLNPNSGYNQRWLAYLKEFGSDDDAVVVVQTDDPAVLEGAIDEAASEILRREDLFHSLFYKNDVGKIRGKALHFLSLEDLEKLDRYTAQGEPIVQGDWNQLQLQRMFNPGASRPQNVSPGSAAAFLEPLADSLCAALADPPRYQSPWPTQGLAAEQLKKLSPSYLMTDDGKMGLLLVRFHGQHNGMSPGSEAIDELRVILREVSQRHPHVELGLTGMPILENDEMRASQADMMQASVLSLVGVACLFVAGFGGLRHPLIAVLTLLIALAWSFGYLTLAVGHLNLLSVSFGAILIGLGIDFGVHYIARYLLIRGECADCGEALRQTAGSIGPGVVTGGVTTAIAFCTATLTHFTGVAELGLIAGGGVILCVVAAVLVLPALLFLSDQHRAADATPTPLPIDMAMRPLLGMPRLALGIACVATVLLGAGMVHLRYDHNLLNLQPVRLESVDLERQILTKSDRSVWFALSVARSPEELLARKAQFDQLDCVESTEQIVELTPPPSEEKSRLITRIGSRLTALPPRAATIEMTSPTNLSLQLSALRANLFSALGDTPLVQKLALAERLLRQRPSPETAQLLASHQMRIANDLLERFRLLQTVANPESPVSDDIPSELRDRFVGANGRHLLRVYAKGDIWDMEHLRHFVQSLETVDPQVTGHPVQSYYASRQMQQSYLHAALYSLLAVAIVLMLDFRSVRSSLLSLLPMVLGMVQTFGVLGLFGIPLNPANMIVLPLILGIGIDDGVHVVHDFRRQAGRYRLGGSTAMAVVITSLTTMVGFGMMIFAKHQGLRSLGQVLTIGVFFCLLNSLLVLPALLSLISARRERKNSDLPAAADPVASLTEETVSVMPEPAAPAALQGTPPRRVRAKEEIVAQKPDDEPASSPATLPMIAPPFDAAPAASPGADGSVVVRRKIIVRRRAA
ncbi:MMPL family transporter [Lignipirellula cremea]|uniref:Membrane protein YdfJ n=1 Tax=Lignipirellula cremea TaxID=2528010 RepID=A0A518DQY4_9BACT|nr:MMPL family transporter [Lignipirellula cremea]QDU94247.1 Membrane protein YdfJ [Lignipirellula cremea]